MLRSIPGHESLPDVVVREVAMLVVGRIEVSQVELTKRTYELRGVPANGPARTDVELGLSELERIERARRPLLDVGHLEACGGVHPVRCVDEACEQHGIEH